MGSEQTPLVRGHVATFEGAGFPTELGVDAIKVGAGPGAARNSGRHPQLQAIREGWCAVGNDVPIIAEDGIAHDKEIFLVLVCGASSVMLASAL